MFFFFLFLMSAHKFTNCRYHSESGWQTLLEVMVEHYGLEVDQASITIFVCLIPVIMDACVKLWVRFFRLLYSNTRIIHAWIVCYGGTCYLLGLY